MLHASTGLDVNSPLFISMATVFATGCMGLFVWSVQRIVRAIDDTRKAVSGLNDKIDVMGNRVTAIEVKQNDTAMVARRTATKMGVRLPKEATE